MVATKKKIALWDMNWQQLNAGIDDVATLRGLLKDFVSASKDYSYEQLFAHSACGHTTFYRFINAATQPQPRTLRDIKQFVIDLWRAKPLASEKDIDLEIVLRALAVRSKETSGAMLAELPCGVFVWATNPELALIELEPQDNFSGDGVILKQVADVMGVKDSSPLVRAHREALEGKQSIILCNILSTMYRVAVGPFVLDSGIGVKAVAMPTKWDKC